MAYRLQTSAPELTDLRSESKATLDLYGCQPDKPSFARACLLARRMVERAVVFGFADLHECREPWLEAVELLEVVGHHGSPVEREDVHHPHEGLPIGAFFPDFELPSITGDRVSLPDLFGAGQPLLFVFVSPNCAPCKALVPDLKDWQAKLLGKVRLVFISNGEVKDNLEKFGIEIGQQMLLQKEREVAEAAKAQWTPTALLVDKTGRVASHAAAGDAEI